MEKFITDEHTGLTNWSEIIIWLPVMKNRSWNQSASTVSAIGAIYRCNGSQRFRVHVSALHLHFCLSKAVFSRLLLHAERPERLVYLLDIADNAVFLADGKADIQRINQRELCNTRRNKELVRRIKLKTEVARCFERGVREAGDADGLRAVLFRRTDGGNDLTCLAGVRDRDHGGIRHTQARLNLHQMRVGQRHRTETDAHQTDVEVLCDGAGCADTENEDVFGATEHIDRLLDLLEVEQLERTLERVDVAAKHTLGNGLNTVGFRQIFEYCSN